MTGPKKMEPLKLSKISPAKSYLFKGDHTWADITIRSWDKAGSISVISDYGNYNAIWASTGCDDIRKFLIELDYAYFMKKAHGQLGMEVDWEETANYILKEICETRRNGDLEDEEAREFFDYIKSAEHNEGMFWRISESEPELHDFLSGIDHPTIKRKMPECEGFWEVIWKVAVETWKEELAQEKSVHT